MEFGIYKIVRMGGDKLVIDGRCHQSGIRRGQSFTLVYEVPVTKDDEGFRSVGKLNHQHVSLQIDKITAYKHDFDELQSGMSARIELSGSGFEHVKEKLVLGDG